MNRIKWVLPFLLFPLLTVSQVKTPFVSYDYESDATYMEALKSLVNQPKQQSTKIIKSIAKLSYAYKDWDTAIEYYERLMLKAPQAENYFRVAVAAARKSLEVSRFFSVPYIIKARKSVLEAHELQPKRADFLNLLIRLYAEIPPLFGGSIAFAEKKANELMDIDPLEGAMIQAYIFEVKNNSMASKSKYADVFSNLKKKFIDSEQWDSEMERDMILSRQSSSIERLREKNQKWGKGKLLSQEQRNQIVNLKEQGYSYRKIKDELNISLGTISYTLKQVSNG